MDDEQWKQTLGVNPDSAFYGTRAAFKAVNDGRRIVIVSSTAGQQGEAFHADYPATKGAIISSVKSVAVKTAPRGITVNSVARGWVDTEMSNIPYQREAASGKSKRPSRWAAWPAPKTSRDRLPSCARTYPGTSQGRSSM